MVIRQLFSEEKKAFNAKVSHPLQSWEWGTFREKTGIAVRRFGIFNADKLTHGLQVFFHPIPKSTATIGYIPKGPLPTKEMFDELTAISKKHHCIFIKIEPNVLVDDPQLLQQLNVATFSPQALTHAFPKLRVSKKPLFTPYTFHIDLTKSEDELLAQMNQKTRYNMRLAQKKGVKVVEDNSKEAFATYLRLSQETTKRQKFFAHNETYHKTLWNTLYPAGIAHLLTARYQGDILATWMLLLFNNVIYYPYGASTSKHREVMASNIMLWEAMRWGKKHNARLFDLWGALGPDADAKHKWYGFHKFKAGYGGKLVQFIGSYDYVFNPALYRLYTIGEKLRWAYLQGTTLLWSVPKLW